MPPAGAMERQVMMMRPCGTSTQPSRHGKRLPLLAGLGMAAAALWRGQETFVGGAHMHHRPAGGIIVVDEPPSGVTCRAYGDKDSERPEWLPMNKWKGESTFRPTRRMMHDDHRQWWHFNAEGKMLGKLSHEISMKLRGKDNPLYFPGADIGSYVIVTNCEKVRVPGKKYHYKLYVRNLSNRPGHTKVERFKDLQQRFPERIIMRAVWGAFPKNPSGRRIFKDRLKLFTGPNHIYYDKNPVDFPMWRVPDCTWETNLRYKDRLATWIKKRGEMILQSEKDKADKKQGKALTSFKDFLTEHLEDADADATKDMTVQEFVDSIQERRARDVREQSEGQAATKKKIKMYPNTKIQVQKVYPKDRHRDVKYWLRRKG